MASLESIIPRETLLDYQKHFKDGCALVCLGSGLDECKYQNDKMYNEWDALQNAEPGPSPMKKRKRSKLDKKKENKRLKSEGKAYTTSKGVHKPARKPMQWVNCKCANKCSVNLSMEDRQMLYGQFGGIESDDQRRQYIVSHQISTVPSQTTTKGSSRRMQTGKYYFHGTNGEQVQVCPNVFHETLQVTRKYVRYAREHGTQGFSKQDGRGRHAPKHKLNDHQKERVLEHINSFPKVEKDIHRR